MKKRYFAFIIVIGIVLVAILTNPNQERHREVVKSEILIYMQKSKFDKLSESETDDGWTGLGQALGTMISGMLVNGIVNNFISSDNYVLFSTTKLTWDGENYIIGAGLFGNVFLTKKLDEVLSEIFIENQ